MSQVTITMPQNDIIDILELLEEARVAFAARQADYALKRDSRMADYMSSKYDLAKRMHDHLHNKFMNA